MKPITVILLATGILAGCVSMSTKQQAPNTFQTKTAQQRQEQLNKVESWDAAGAISIQQAHKSPMIMRYEWQQMGPSNYQIELSGSLNMGAATITGQPGRVTLRKGDQAPVSAPTAEQLMQKNLGWSLPINSLWYWARGLPAPGPNDGVKYDDYGHLIMLRQYGWLINYQEYQTVEGVDLPQVIELQGRGLLIRLVIKQWKTIK